MNTCKIQHPLRPGLYSIQQVLRDLAAQENCDGEPYDQMMLAASYIDMLEALININYSKGDNNE